MANLLRKVLERAPDLLQLASRHPQTYPFFLNSGAQQLQGTRNNARYDILMACPRQRLTLRADRSLWLDEDKLDHSLFLEELDRRWQQAYCAVDDCDVPFRGGWFVYLGYELAQQIEPRLSLAATDSRLPLASAVRVPAAIIHDYLRDETIIVAEPDAHDCIDRISDDIAKLAFGSPVGDGACVTMQEDPPQTYFEQVVAIKDYIREGDVFQVNLSRLWQGEIADEATAPRVYQRLLQHNPAPFAALCQFEHASILSSSPERLIERRGQWVETRPIAGTHPRFADEAADAQQRAALMRHPKERAEHIMLIDLERNDLGRICEPGTVSVSELMVLESYAHVHHIVSNIRGQLRAGISPGQIIAACFPGGTITGCPKVRCMEIIAELERGPRGAYTGSLGYLNHDGDMDLNILIRTIVLEAGRAHFRAGAGIVADSDPQRELEETRAKAKGMWLALQGEYPQSCKRY